MKRITSSDHWRRRCACCDRTREHADRPVADLPAVAVRAVQEVTAPALAGAGDVGQLVDGAGREQHLSRLEVRPDCESRARSRRSRRRRGRRRSRRRSARTSARPACEQLGRRHPVAGEEPLHVRGGSVPRRSGVDDDDPAPRAAEHERGAQAGGAASDDRDVIGLGVHGSSVHAGARGSHASLPFPGTAGSVAPWRTRRRSRMCWPRSARA